MPAPPSHNDDPSVPSVPSVVVLLEPPPAPPILLAFLAGVCWGTALGAGVVWLIAWWWH